MDDRLANIDLVFRNGLKDYEALPPEDVWNNIQPAVARKRSFVFLKAAAVFAAVVSMGIIAYMLGRTAAVTGDSMMAGFNPSTVLNIYQPSVVRAGTVMHDIKETDSPVSFIPYSDNSSAKSEELTVADNISPVNEANTELSGGKADPDTEPVSSIPENLDEVITVKSMGSKADIKIFDPGKAKPAERWSISALASPTYYSKTGSGTNSIVKNMIATERSVSSVSGGLSVSYNLSRRVSIQTGVYYASHGQQVGGINSYTGFQKYSSAKGASAFTVLTSDGPVFSGNADVFMSGSDARVQTMYTSNVFDPDKANLVPIDNSIIQKFGYVQMPLIVRYKFFDRNLDLNLSGGISYDFLVGNSAFIRNGRQKYDLGQTEGLNNFIFSSSLGMGMEYSISQKMSFNVEPTFRYFLNPFNDDAGTLIHPYSIGVFSGFSYKF
ncbi:MAG TPA: outer membrane beta-barrel protein [Bacteroidales bacterium]|nr:outer membrane beta-barrel protein [Bacteroidales bacterium]